MSSLGAWEHPYINIVFSKGINIDIQQDWYLKGTLDYNVSGTIEGIEPEVTVSYEERTRYRDTPHFALTILDDANNFIDSISLSSRDIYSEPEDFLSSKLKLKIPLKQLNDEFIDFINNNPEATIFTKTYKIKLEVKLEREKWFSSWESKPDLVKTADIDLNLNIDTDATILTDIPQGNTTLELKGICSSNLRIVTGDIDEIQYEKFENSYVMDWNVYYHVIIDAIISNADFPAIFLNQVYEVYEKNGKEKQDEILEFKLEKNFDSTVSSEPINFTHLFRERGYWKWYKEYYMAGSPSLRTEPCGPYEKTFKWIIKICDQTDPQTLIIPQKELLITIKVPESKINNIWKALRDTEDADNASRIGFVIGVGLAAAGVVVGLATYAAAVAIGGTFLGPLGALAVAIGLLVVGVIVGVSTGLISAAKKTSAKKLLNKAKKECSIEYDSNYNEVYNYLDALEEYEEIPNEIPIYLKNFIFAIRSVIEVSNAINISFSRYLSAVLDGKQYAIRLQYEACESMMRFLEGEVLKVNNNKDHALLYVSETPTEFNDDLLQTFNAISSNTLDNETKEKLKQIDAIKDMVEKLEKEDFSDINIDKEVYDQFFQNISNTIKDVYDYAIDFYFDSLYKIREIRRVNQLHGSDLLAALFNYGLLSLDEFQDRLKKVGISYRLGALMTFRWGPIQELQRLGIRTTFDLLINCKTRKQRKQLEKTLNNPDYDLLWWANIVDLMRIKGLTEQNAIFLEKIGVDTVKELATRNIDNLYEKLDNYWLKQPQPYRLEKKEVKSWIESADALRPILEY